MIDHVFLVRISNGVDLDLLHRLERALKFGLHFLHKFFSKSDQANVHIQCELLVLINPFQVTWSVSNPFFFFLLSNESAPENSARIFQAISLAQVLDLARHLCRLVIDINYNYACRSGNSNREHVKTISRSATRPLYTGCSHWVQAAPPLHPLDLQPELPW